MTTHLIDETFARIARMQRRRHGFTTTLLMLVPMLGVPAMAIFGIPQFAPLISSMASHADEADIPGFQETRIGHSASGSLRTVQLGTVESLDLFRPYDAPTAGPSAQTTAQQSVNWSDPLKSQVPSSPNRTGTAANFETTPREASVRSSRQMHQQVYDIFADDFKSQPTASATSANSYSQPSPPLRTVSLNLPDSSAAPTANHSLTWRQATDQLNRYGATSYRLTPGVRADDYRFVCVVESPDDHRIMRRFEAESSDPLIAVEHVLAQIETWRRRP